MYKQYRILLLILVFSLLLNCSREKKSSFDNQTYDALVLKAEKSLLTKTFDSATVYFDEAFKVYSKLLAFDMNNALILAVKTEDWKQAKFWSEQLAKKGVGLPYFKKAIFKAFHNTEEWQYFVAEYDSYTKYFESHSNQEMIDSLEILEEIDQQAYCLLPSKKIDLSNVFDKTVFLDSLLFRLINNTGFPSEEKVGVNVYKDSLISPIPKFSGLFRHSYQANSNLVKRYLSDAVEKGELKKSVYEYLLIGDSMDYMVVDCKIYESKYVSQNSIDNLFKEKVMYNNLNINEFDFYAPLAILDLQTSQSSIENMIQFHSYLCDYKNCNEYD